MATALERLQEMVSALHLDDSLLFLNRILAASRGEHRDPSLEPILSARNSRVPAFIVHFLAKQLLLNSSNLNICTLNGTGFLRLLDQYFQLDDPICGDPTWPTADPSGFFERMLAQQIPSQVKINLQPYGLALGLFRDVGIVQTSKGPYDIRTEIEHELGMRLEEFMALGMLCSTAPVAAHHNRPCYGTFNHLYLAQANIQGLDFSRWELWEPFLRRVARDRDGFRHFYRSDPRYQARDGKYAQFEFNPLLRFPVIDLGKGNHLAVDPHLLTERTTFGVFYDLEERGGKEYCDKFGYVFDRFVGNLLKSVCLPGSLWWESDPSREKTKNAVKVADWAYRGKDRTVLFECKSLRPSLNLTTYGSEDDVQAVRKRIVSALAQLIEHANSIQAGKWVEENLKPTPVVGAVVTYGRIRTANSPFMRNRIAEDLKVKSLTPIPYVVLSLEELDHAIRLVELNHPLDEVILTLATGDGSFDPLQRFTTTFEGQYSISTFSYNLSQQFMDMSIRVRTPEPTSGERYVA